MARKPRLHFSGAVYHVMLRGNAGQSIFLEDEDREHFYALIADGVERFGHRIHGFCLMGNHVHFALQVADVPLSKIMQNISFRYTRWMNKKYGRVGHLFQGRFKAILVEQDTYLLELIRYIHLNPVRAKMVSNIDQYPWSGHATYLGRQVLSWVTTEWVLKQFGVRMFTCRQRYEKFVQAGVMEGRREDFHRGGKDDGRILGEDQFSTTMLNHSVEKKVKLSLNQLIKKVCKQYEVSESELCEVGGTHYLSEARSTIAWLAEKSRQVSLTQVSERLQRDISTLSRGAKNIEKRMKASPELFSWFDGVI